MHKIKRIFEAEVKEFYKEDLVKAYHGFFFSKEEAVKFCTDIVKERLKQIKGLELATPKSLLDFMSDEDTKFKLCVAERSTSKRNYEDSDGYQQAFHKFLKEGDKNLYDQLLSTVVCNIYFYDYFGNEMDVYTNPEAFVGYWEGTFTEEDCKGGKYRGNFYYHELYNKSKLLPFTINDRWYFSSAWANKEQVEDEDGERETYATYSSMSNELNDAVNYACGELLGEMCKYFVDEKGFVADLTEEQELELFGEKVTDYSVKVSVISSNHIVFDSQQELAEYYAERVANDELSEENIYDFLLSLVKCEERYYDIHGNLLRSRIIRQELDGTAEYDIIPDFSMETAKDVFLYQEKRKEKINGSTR